MNNSSHNHKHSGENGVSSVNGDFKSEPPDPQQSIDIVVGNHDEEKEKMLNGNGHISSKNGNGVSNNNYCHHNGLEDTVPVPEPTRFQRFVASFTGGLENFFYRWGYTVGSRPYQSIALCLLLTIICSLGLLKFQYEERPDKLLISQTSQLAYDTDWLRDNFPSPVRFSVVMVTAENVLTSRVLLKIMDIQERIQNITVLGRKWEEICFKLPITKGIQVNSRRRRNLDSLEDPFDDNFFDVNADKQMGVTNSSGEDPYHDAMLDIPEDLYCSFVENLEQACWQTGPLELWGFNRTLISSLSEKEIIHKINHEKIGPVFGRPVNYTFDLGGKIRRNEKGEIISAESIILFWAIAVNKTALSQGDAVRDDGTGELADELSLAWEARWLSMMEELTSATNKSEMTVHYVSGRSFGDVYKLTMYNDMKIVVLGFTVMFAYVTLMLGRFNMIEQRPYLSLVGISCTALGGIVACGICSAFGIPFGNVNKVLPFLLLGIGVDDMFIIMQCWKNLNPSILTKGQTRVGIPHRIGMALKTAGASITVTSLTDMAAFAIGATTLLPGLKSFCVYAAVGIVAVFFFQVTVFVGFLAIDQKRLEEKRNAYFWWVKYRDEDFLPNKWNQSSFLQVFFEKVFAKLILTKAGKVFVILLTLTFLGINLNGQIRLKQEFDPMWFLAQDSHIVRYIDARKAYYPNSGFTGFIVGHEVNWTASFPAFDAFVQKTKESDAIFQFDPWYQDFKQYANRNFKTDIPNTPVPPQKFQLYLGKFLFSRMGSKYRQYFKAEEELSCGHRASPIHISMMPFRFKTFRGSREHIPGMNELKAIVNSANITFNEGSSGRLFPWSSVFVSWETDEIITAELYRSVSLSLICVLITVFFLVFNVRVCFFSGICVILTVIDVGGVMYYTGMSIDTISVVANVVTIGLCVDYAAHIGLAFLVATGDKNTRAAKALTEIGPAVVNGGFSTFLGILLLVNSETHALQSFFKVLTAVVFFGLFHGLVFLPVLLSMAGPDSYTVSKRLTSSSASKSHPNLDRGNNNGQVLLPISSKSIIHS